MWLLPPGSDVSRRRSGGTIPANSRNASGLPSMAAPKRVGGHRHGSRSAIPQRRVETEISDDTGEINHPSTAKDGVSLWSHSVVTQLYQSSESLTLTKTTVMTGHRAGQLHEPVPRQMTGSVAGHDGVRECSGHDGGVNVPVMTACANVPVMTASSMFRS
jgi:hypothetical protein